MKKKQVSFTTQQMELAAKLTPLQRKFIIELIKPKTTQRQAYINAGGTAKKEKDQDTAASRMSSDVKVKAFYDSIINSKTEEAIISKDRAIQILADLANDQELTPRDRISALNQASKMLKGWHVPVETEISGKDGESIAITQIERKII